MDRVLLEQLDQVVEERGVTRSEIIRDLVRNEVARAKVRDRVPAMAALTLVYDHHVRDLTERLTEVQHKLGESVRCALHIHLDADHCMEIVILRGRSDEVSSIAEQLLATRGVVQGGIHIVPTLNADAEPHQHNHSHSSPDADPQEQEPKGPRSVHKHQSS